MREPVSPARRRRVIRNGTGLAVVTTFAVVVAAVVLGYGRPGGPADSSAPVAGPSVEPLPGAPPAGPSPPPATTAGSSPAPSTPTTRPTATAAPVPAPATPPRPVVPVPAGGGAATTGPSFTPIAVQAEAAGNVRTGGAEAFTCATCAGGARVGHLAGASQLFIDVTVPVAGQRTLEVTYETDGPRALDVSVGGVRVARPELTGVGWTTPMTYQVVVTLPAGPVRLGFFNDTGPAPDVDLVVIR